ncbi:MAG: PD-(D/E)XK nuclease family protein, partial [Thermoguttaceae bacterium]
EAICPINTFQKRRIVRRLIDEQHASGRMRYFGSICSASGFVDLACELISELKRLEIWPEHLRLACESADYTRKHQELCELYEAYQLTLRENQLYDLEGRLWSARDCLRRGQRRPFDNLRLLVVDGFTDFTRTQHEILEHLGDWIQEVIISLPLEFAGEAREFFSKPRQTLSELRRRHPNLSIEELSRTQDSTWPAMSRLEEKLFINPRRAGTALKAEGIEILPARMNQGEMELIGGKIKRLLADGSARPGEIAVVFRRAIDSGTLAAQVFQRLGIPFALEKGQTLDRAPLVRALTALLALDLDDWPFRKLLGALGSNYFQPNWPQWQAGNASKIVEQSIRHLQISRGRGELLQRLEADSDNPTLEILKRLAAVFDRLPEKATISQWAVAWEMLSHEIGLLRVAAQRVGVQSDLNDEASQLDILAWNCLISALSNCDALDKRLKRRSPELDRRGALLALLDIVGSVRLPTLGDEVGYVRILSAPSVRALHIPYLFLAGLSEKVFPLAEREDRLYSEAEYLRLIENGLPLSARADRQRDEMLLFYEVLTRATRRLYLSFPAWDEAAQPLLPSPYLSEAARVLDLSPSLDLEIGDFRPVPAGDEPLSLAQFRVMAFDKAFSEKGDVALLAEYLQNQTNGMKQDATTRLFTAKTPFSPLARNILNALEIAVLRENPLRFSKAEGILSGRATKKLLAAEFSSKRCFTASELEHYAACPFRFLLQNILKLEGPEELSLDSDLKQRGHIVHNT